MKQNDLWFIVKAKKLYSMIEKDFDLEKFSDDWDNMDFNEYISQSFKKTYMGVLCNNSDDIKKVFTAVFPSKKVMKKVLDKNRKQTLLFTHHPMVWDITKKNVWTNPDKKLLKRFKNNKISIYALHVPLDNNGSYSTSFNFAKQLGLDLIGGFSEYHGAKVGIIGKTDLKTVKNLQEKFSDAVGHETILYQYGDGGIKEQKVAVIAGGGNNIDNLKEILGLEINTFITGISVKNDHSKKAHEFAEKNKINILGGTHYSTEKFACMKMCEYFEKMGLECEFLEGAPVMEDM